MINERRRRSNPGVVCRWETGHGYPIRALLLISGLLAYGTAAHADDLFRIDFEDHDPGRLVEGQPPESEQYQWTQSADAAMVQEKLSHGGGRALELGGPRVTVRRRFDAGKEIVPLTSGVQYYDFRVYPRCSNREYCVVARMFDHPSGHSFMDIHFRDNGVIGVMVAGESTSDPGVMAETGHQWRRKRWLRITLAMDREAQTFDLYLDGRKSPSGPFQFSHRFGQLETLTFEGPHSDDPNAFFYYDDLHWTDVNPLAGM